MTRYGYFLSSVDDGPHEDDSPHELVRQAGTRPES